LHEPLGEDIVTPCWVEHVSKVSRENCGPTLVVEAMQLLEASNSHRDLHTAACGRLLLYQRKDEKQRLVFDFVWLLRGWACGPTLVVEVIIGHTPPTVLCLLLAPHQLII
jgi:hypothetical protein